MNEIQHAARRLVLLLIAFVALGGGRASAQLMAVRTNALLDVALVPNLGLEVITGGKTSLNASVFGTTKVWDKAFGHDVQFVGVMPEFRYWFNGRPLTREYIGLSGSVVAYDITWSRQRYKGDAYAGAVTFGYAFLLGLHCSLECYGGIGLLYYDQQRYYIGDRIRNNYYNADGLQLVPYNLGVTFTWIINKKAKVRNP